jgi:hypothetical protein
VRQMAADQALLDRFDQKDATLTAAEYRKGQKLSAARTTQQAKVTAEAMAREHQARIDAIAGKLSGGRMASIRKAYGASAKLNAETARVKASKASKATGSKRKSADQNKSGFANTPTPYQHKFMWVDKNGKVYHRRMSLPDPQRKQTESLAKYRR